MKSRTRRIRPTRTSAARRFRSISCDNGPNGDMFMNYMDYTDDACMFMFTAGPGRAHAGDARRPAGVDRSRADARHRRLRLQRRRLARRATSALRDAGSPPRIAPTSSASATPASGSRSATATARFSRRSSVINDLGFVAGGWRVEKHPRLLADLTGDGAADIVGFGDDGVWTALNNGNGSFRGAAAASSRDFGFTAGGWRVERHPRLLGDVTGDGRADIVGFGNDGVFVAAEQRRRHVSGAAVRDRRSRLRRRRLAGRPASALPGQSGRRRPRRHRRLRRRRRVGGARATATARSRRRSSSLADFGFDAGGWRVDQHPRFVVDLTGDGRADIVGFGDAGVWVARNNGNGTFQPPQLVVADFGFDAGGWRVDQHVRAAGGPDRRRASGHRRLRQRRRVGLVQQRRRHVPAAAAGAQRTSASTLGGWRVDRHPRFAADLTGDGRADIVGFGDLGVFVSLNNGSGGF